MLRPAVYYPQPDATAEILKESPSSVIIKHLNHNGCMSLAQVKYIFKQIQPHFHEENRDITWPAPASALSASADAANK